MAAELQHNFNSPSFSGIGYSSHVLTIKQLEDQAKEKNKAADSPADMVKMLTPDGKLVEVPRSLVESSSPTQKASNKDILSWMKNPSKR